MDDGERYDEEVPTTLEEREWYADFFGTIDDMCPSTWVDKDDENEQTWTCTLKEGHPGRHVGGYDHARCGARWGVDTPLHPDLDCGPDDGS